MSAFRTISKETLKAFQAMFNKDFEIFDYDKEPADIYGTIANDSDFQDPK